jgi:transcription initiation factor IIE alpha subunit
MNAEQTRQITKAHLEDGIDECRWCFAVDMERVKGNEIARYDFPDSTLLHFSCPRCGGEFSLYVPGWGEGYIKKIIRRLHPEIGEDIDDELFREVNDRVLYVDQLGDYLDC